MIEHGHTMRLALCAPSQSDVPEIYTFLGNPSTMQYTEASASLTDCREKLRRYEESRSVVGFAPWTIRLRNEQRVIGWGGLYVDPFDPAWGLEVGYFFHPSVWGFGYAIELARYCISLFDESGRDHPLRAFVHPQNLASFRVLEKCGFRQVRPVADMNRLLMEYERKLLDT